MIDERRYEFGRHVCTFPGVLVERFMSYVQGCIGRRSPAFNFVPAREGQHSLFGTWTEIHTSRKPDIKFFGSLALGSSSCLKYFIMCVSCFQ